MNFSKNRKIIRFILISMSFIIVTAILWNTYDFSQKFKDEERIKMELLSVAQKDLATKPLNDKSLKLI